MTIKPETLETNEDGKCEPLPRTATDIIVFGNNWYEFTLNCRRFLLHYESVDSESLLLLPRALS